MNIFRKPKPQAHRLMVPTQDRLVLNTDDWKSIYTQTTVEPVQDTTFWADPRYNTDRFDRS